MNKVVFFVLYTFLAQIIPFQELKVPQQSHRTPSFLNKAERTVRKQTLQSVSQVGRIQQEFLNEKALKSKLFPARNRAYLNQVSKLKKKENSLGKPLWEQTKTPLKLGSHWEHIRSQMEFFIFVFFLIELFILDQMLPNFYTAIIVFGVSILTVFFLLGGVDQLIKRHIKRVVTLLMIQSQVEGSQEHFVRAISNEPIFLRPSGGMSSLISDTKFMSLGSFFALMALLVLGFYNRYLMIPFSLFLVSGGLFLLLQIVGEKKYRLSEQVWSDLKKDKGRFHLLDELKVRFDENKKNITSLRHRVHERDRIQEAMSQYILTTLVIMVFLLSYLLIKATDSILFLVASGSVVTLLLFWISMNTFFFKLGTKSSRIKETILGVSGLIFLLVSGVILCGAVGLMGEISTFTMQILFVIFSLCLTLSLISFLSFIYQANKKLNVLTNSKDENHERLYLRQNTQEDYWDFASKNEIRYPSYAFPITPSLRRIKFCQDFLEQMVSAFSFVVCIIWIEVFLGQTSVHSIYFIVGMIFSSVMLGISIGATLLVESLSGAKGFLKNHFQHRRTRKEKVVVSKEENLKEERGKEYTIEKDPNEYFQYEELILGGGLKRRGSQWGGKSLIRVSSILWISLSLSLAVLNVYFLLLPVFLFVIVLCILGYHQLMKSRHSKKVLNSLMVGMMLLQVVVGICLCIILKQWIWSGISMVGLLFWVPLGIKNIFFVHKDKKETPLMVDLLEKHTNDISLNKMNHQLEYGVMVRYDEEKEEEKIINFIQDEFQKAVKNGKEKVCFLLDVDGTLYSADHREQTKMNYFLINKLLKEYPFVEVILISGRHYLIPSVLYNLFPLIREIDVSLYDRLWLAPNNGALVISVQYFIQNKERVLNCENEEEIPYWPIQEKSYVDPLEKVRIEEKIKIFTKEEQRCIFNGIDHLGRSIGIPHLMQCYMGVMVPDNVEYLSIEIARKELSDEDQKKIAQLSDKELTNLILFEFSEEEKKRLHIVYSGKTSDEETFTLMLTRKWKQGDGKEYMVRKSNIFLFDNLEKLGLDRAWMIGLGDSTKPGGNDRDFIMQCDLRGSVISQEKVAPETEDEFHLYGEGSIKVFSQLYVAVTKAMNKSLEEKKVHLKDGKLKIPKVKTTESLVLSRLIKENEKSLLESA